MTRSKAIWKSKTFWLGVVALLIPLLEGVADLFEMGGEAYAWVTGAVGVLVILLRFVTRQPVTLSGDTTKPLLVLLLAGSLMACSGEYEGVEKQQDAADDTIVRPQQDTLLIERDTVQR